MAYDLFGNGKTALKASASRGVEQDSIRYARLNNPATTVDTSTAREWQDADSDFVVDCDLLNRRRRTIEPTGGDFCGPWLTPNFGNSRPSTTYDRGDHGGLGRAAVELGVLGRHPARDHSARCRRRSATSAGSAAISTSPITSWPGRATTPPFSVVVPTDARLPTNPGATITGLFDPNGVLPVRNVVKNASEFGKQQAHWDGVDITRRRPAAQRPVPAGRRQHRQDMTDNCDVAAKVDNPSTRFCHVETGFLAQYKALASYTLPYDVRVSGTVQSLPGPQVAANLVYAGVIPSLGRAPTGGQTTVNLIEPGTVYGDRLNQVDLRFTKILRLNGARPARPERGYLQRVQLRRGADAAERLYQRLAAAAVGHSAAIRQVQRAVGLLNITDRRAQSSVIITGCRAAGVVVTPVGALDGTREGSLMTRVLRAPAACLLAAAVLVTVAGAAGDGPLTAAVKAGNLQAVRALVKSGADVNVRSGDGSTPLLWAVAEVERRDRARCSSPPAGGGCGQRLRHHAAAARQPHRRRGDGRAAPARRRQSVAQPSRGRDAADGGGARGERPRRPPAARRAASTSTRRRHSRRPRR